MKCYVFVHSHLSSIQQGIQAAHVVARICREPNQDALDWMDSHETLVILEGGNSEELSTWNDRIRKSGFYDYATFREDEETIDKLFTAVGFIYPDFTKNFWQKNLMKLIEDVRLAS